MKENTIRYSILLMICVLSTWITNTQAQIVKPELRTATVTDSTKLIRLSYIKASVNTINTNLKKYKKTQHDIEGESSEGGSLTKYYDGKTVVKMVVEFYGEMGRSGEEYYYDAGKLLFYYSVTTNYDMPMYVKDFKIKSQTDERYYFLDKQIIKYICHPNKTLTAKQLEKLSSETLQESAKRLSAKG